MARAEGYFVRALIRPGNKVDHLADLGVGLVHGDVTDRASIERAASGMHSIVHSAAVIGGTWSTATAEDFHNVNYLGVVNVLDAAAMTGVARVVLLNSVIINDFAVTITERSPIIGISPNDSPYTAAKRSAFYEGMHRASLGDRDVMFVFPGGIYGPSSMTERAVVPASFNGTLLLALSGQLDEYVDMPLMWAHVDDVALVTLAALAHGVSGERYLACGRAEDVCSLPSFCNIACEIAGVGHRVGKVDLATGGDKIGSMRRLAERIMADPLIDPSGTTRALGVEPRSLRDGIGDTVEWFRKVGKL
jgi:dihydroflavonol-4-reductase